MTSSAGPGDDKNSDKPEQIFGWPAALGYLERRAERTFESRQAIARIAGAVHEAVLDIASLLAGNPSPGGQAELERAVGSLQGLTMAADQASAVTVAGGGDSGASRSAEVDLSGIKAAVETRRESANTNARRAGIDGLLQDADGKTRNHAAKAKALSALDAAMADGKDQGATSNSAASAPGDSGTPASDAPLGKADRFKLAFANGDGTNAAKSDASSSTGVDRPLLPEKTGNRPNAVSLKLDHAGALHAEPATTVRAPAAPDAAMKPPRQGAMKAGPGAIHAAAAPRTVPTPAGF